MGHSSLTLYIQLYLAGYGLEMDDLKSFRTWGSRTPGHPEHGHTVGVETTTGPLGQGFGNAVGMAMAARYERGLYDPDAPAGSSPFDHTIWCFASDGDLEEGISSEASSLAGHQKLGNLVVLWDDNHISIEGDTQVAISEDTAARYEAYGWHVQRVEPKENGDLDPGALHEAMQGRPAGDRAALLHRGALDHRLAGPERAEHRRRARRRAGRRRRSPPPRSCSASTRRRPSTSRTRSSTTCARRSSAAARHTRSGTAGSRNGGKSNPERAAEYERIRAGELPKDWEQSLPSFETGKDMATRKASGAVLKALGPVIPELWGGSADLAGSNNTTFDDSSFLPKGNEAEGADPYGRTVHFGIREHAMGSAMNGIALHGNTRVYGGTFLTFSDYMRPGRAAGRADGRRRSPTCGRTTPSVWARTAPPTSRSSTWRRCAPSRA